MREEVFSWLGQMERDFEAAGHSFESGDYYIVVFLCQQSVEKGLKAIYINEWGKLLRTHDLVKLAQDVGAPPEVVETCEELNPHYIATRYPLDVEYEKSDAQEALEKAKEVTAWIRGRV